jgi:chorismate dehydratase
MSNTHNRSAATRPPWRVASVSFLNARPLIWGLENDPAVSLRLDVPSRLLAALSAGQVDVALLPVIDYQRLDGLRIVPSGGIGCDGPTLTVRIFSGVPIQRIESLACDTDSHTSVALARILLARRYGIRPELTELGSDIKPGAARLLIGDKVVCEEPADLPHQLDLGAAWKDLTGLPFVFAAWVARGDIELGDLPERLTAARMAGLGHIPEILEQFAVPRGWPVDLARRYLTEYLKFEIGPRHLEAIGLFHQWAAEEGLIPRPARPLNLIKGTRSFI